MEGSARWDRMRFHPFRVTGPKRTHVIQNELVPSQLTHKGGWAVSRTHPSAWILQTHKPMCHESAGHLGPLLPCLQI